MHGWAFISCHRVKPLQVECCITGCFSEAQLFSLVVEVASVFQRLLCTIQAVSVETFGGKDEEMGDMDIYE